MKKLKFSRTYKINIFAYVSGVINLALIKVSTHWIFRAITGGL